MQACTLFFFSTSSLGIPLLKTLSEDSRFKVLALITQPDQEVGRGKHLSEPVCKSAARSLRIPVYQPEKLSKDFELLGLIKAWNPDFFLSIAYGQLLSEEWLKVPRIAALNVHPSLLPLYRGPSPIQSALLNGEKETGLTLMKMEKEMDTGPIAFQVSYEISPHVTAGFLFDDLAVLAAKTIPEAILEVQEKGTSIFREQNEGQATFSKLIEKEDGRLDFQRSAHKLFNQFRAYTPWPGVFTTYRGKRLKFLDCEWSDRALEPGRVHCEKHELWVGTTDGALRVKQIQLEGKDPLHVDAFIRGQPEFCSSFLPS